MTSSTNLRQRMSRWHAVALRQKINQFDDFQLVTLPKIFRDVCKWARVATHFKASVQGGAVSNVLAESWGVGRQSRPRFDGDRQARRRQTGTCDVAGCAIVIRQLGSGDVDVVRRLLDTFGEVFEDMDTYTRAQPREAYLEGLLCSDHFIALAALQDGVVIGGLAAYELKKFERERSEIYIYDLAVAARHRRRGIATGLIAQLTTIAKARGAYVIFVQADLTDPAAIALYTKQGTRENVLHFDIAVP